MSYSELARKARYQKQSGPLRSRLGLWNHLSQIQLLLPSLPLLVLERRIYPFPTAVEAYVSLTCKIPFDMRLSMDTRSVRAAFKTQWWMNRSNR